MDKEKVIKALEDFNENRICLPHLIPWDEIADAVAILKKQAEPPKKQKAKRVYKSCSNCLHSKLQAARGTGGCYYYRCKKHRMWGATNFHCSDWSKGEYK